VPAPFSGLEAWARRNWWAILVGLVVVATGGVAALVLELRRDEPPGVTVPASCSMSADRVVDIRLRGDGEVTRLGRGENGEIEVNGEPCGVATVRTVEAIIVEGADGSQTLIVDLSNGAFAPGFSDEGDGSSEIEITVDLRAGEDAVAIQGGEGADRIAVSVAGVNLNAAESSPDVDVTMRGVESLRIAGGGGDDRITASPEGEAATTRPLLLAGGEGDDELFGGPGDDILRGGPGDDVLRGGPGDDELWGGEGHDVADYGEATARVEVVLPEGRATGASGNDTLSEIEGIAAGAGDDLLIGDEADNELRGAEGDDVLVGGPGDDTLDGGPGQDTADYSFAPTGVTVDLGSGEATDASGGSDTVTDVERVLGGLGDDLLRGDGRANVLLGGPGDDDLHGGGGADRLFGDAGDDLLEGGRGNDVIRGGPGDDRVGGGPGDDTLEGGIGEDALEGGRGTDTADYSRAQRGVEVNLSANEAPSDGSRGADTLKGIEDVIGGPRSDVLRGDAGANVLVGRDGDDVLRGGGGDDTLQGEGGNDILRGGAGDDTLRGGDGNDVLLGEDGGDDLDGGPGSDTASYATAGASVLVDLASGTAFTQRVAVGDELVRIENVIGGPFADRIIGDGGTNVLAGGPGNDVLIGNAGNDVLRGGPGDDLLRGGRGDDRLDGASGNDRLAGEEGDDVLDGGDGVDVADYVRSSEAVIVDLEAGTAEHGRSVDTLMEIENVFGSRHDDTISGDDGDNTLRGLGGADAIFGRGGDDLLFGGPGPDRLDGGPGDDVCVGGPDEDTFIDCETEREQPPPEAARARAGSARARRA